MADELYLGGTFNPPHLAHTACAAAAAVAAGLGGVVLVPTGQSALKNAADVAPAIDRLAMTRLAAAAVESAVPCRVDDREIGRPGTTYTVDTVADLRAGGGLKTVNWLIGADQLLNLHRWHRVDEMLSLATFWVMARPGYPIDWTAVYAPARSLQDRVVAVPQFEISATDIRRRLRAGEPTDGLIAPAVRDYCVDRRLYQGG